MKILIIGLGSMGKRRIRNIQALGRHTIVGFDTDAKTTAAVRRKYKINILPALDMVAEKEYDLAVIATPPGAHLLFATLCAKRKIPFFVELNLITAEAQAIEALTKKYQVLGLPSNTELFDNDIAALGKLTGPKFKGYFIFHLGQHIADWHPWEKEGKHFIFHPKTNGMREMLRVELPWMIDLFGPVKGFSAQRKRFLTHTYNVDDFLTIEITFASGNVGVVILDLISPQVIKRLDVVGQDKVVTWNERENAFRVTTRGATRTTQAAKKRVEKRYQFHEDAHLAEMRHVLRVVNKKENSKLHFAKEINILHLIDEIEKNVTLQK
jgi:predicted dehydrogenase